MEELLVALGPRPGGGQGFRQGDGRPSGRGRHHRVSPKRRPRGYGPGYRQAGGGLPRRSAWSCVRLPSRTAARLWSRSTKRIKGVSGGARLFCCTFYTNQAEENGICKIRLIVAFLYHTLYNNDKGGDVDEKTVCQMDAGGCCLPVSAFGVLRRDGTSTRRRPFGIGCVGS